MEAEFFQLAREAAAALQGPSWVEVAQLFISGVGLACIVGGLFSMKAAGKRRDREIDELASAFRKQGEAMTQGFAQQSQAMTQGFAQQSQAMTQAFTQQGQALERQGRALERQGEVLAELLRRGQ